MSPFAIFVLILIIVAGAIGWHSGFIKQLGQLGGMILGIAACRLFGPGAVAMFCGSEASSTDHVLYTVLVYIALYIIVYMAVTLIVRMMRTVVHKVRLGIIDHLAGALLRIVLWLVLLSLALNIWVLVVPSTSLVEDAMFNRILWFGPYLLGTESALKICDAVSKAVGG